MSVDQIRLQNFMAFADTDWIELRRLNLLLGRNSSGKSAIIRALRLMKQSLATDSNQPLTLTAKGGVNMGSFEAMLHQEPTPETMKDGPDAANEVESDEAKHWLGLVTFGFRGILNGASLPDNDQARWPELVCALNLNGDVPSLPFEVSAGYSWYTKTEKRIRLRKLEVYCGYRHASEEPVEVYAYDHNEFGEEVCGSSLPGLAAHLKELLSLSNLTHFLPDLEAPEAGAEPTERDQRATEGIRLFWDACKNEITVFLKSIQHVGPVRPRPERSYIITDEAAQEWESQGWKFFLDYLTAPFADEESYRKLNRWLRVMDLGATIRPNNLLKVEKPIESLRAVVSVLLDESGLGEVQAERSLPDVGYGASQIVPVIVACLTAPTDALVLIEEPELHLHPEAQANIADLLIESINERIPETLDTHPGEQLERDERSVRADEVFKEAAARGMRVSRRFMIETHSEHVLRRVQLRVAQAIPLKLEPTDSEEEDLERSVDENTRGLQGKDVGLAFVTRDRTLGVSQVKYVRFDYLGRPINPPAAFGWFFDRSDLDSTAISLAKAKAAHLESKYETSDRS